MSKAFDYFARAAMRNAVEIVLTIGSYFISKINNTNASDQELQTTINDKIIESSKKRNDEGHTTDFGFIRKKFQIPDIQTETGKDQLFIINNLKSNAVNEIISESSAPSAGVFSEDSARIATQNLFKTNLPKKYNKLVSILAEDKVDNGKFEKTLNELVGLLQILSIVQKGRYSISNEIISESSSPSAGVFAVGSANIATQDLFKENLSKVFYKLVSILAEDKFDNGKFEEALNELVKLLQNIRKDKQ